MKKNKNGFTLVEIIMALAIFSIIIGITSGVFLSGLQAQRRTLASQELLDQTSYALEYMSRALRMARKELSAPVCLSENGLNYEIPKAYRETGNSGWGIKFINYKSECQEFYWDTGTNQLMESKDGGAAITLTSGDLEITSFKIKLAGKEQPPEDYEQPRVTLFLKIKGKGQKPEEQPEIKIQTTISQKNLDIKY